MTQSKKEALKRKLEIHVETTEECLENFSLDQVTKDAMEADNTLFKEVIEYLNQ